jgi:hypothetical protein
MPASGRRPPLCDRRHLLGMKARQVPIQRVSQPNGAIGKAMHLVERHAARVFVERADHAAPAFGPHVERKITLRLFCC